MKLPLRTLLVILGAATTIYALVLLLTGQAPLGRLAASLSSPGGLAAAGLCLLNYALRGWRWRLWMAAQGRPLAIRSGLRYYLAGYTFTPTPANVGESLRGMMLDPPLPADRSLAIFGAERIADLLGLLLLAMPAGALLLAQAARWRGADTGTDGALALGGSVLVIVVIGGATLASARTRMAWAQRIERLMARVPAMHAARLCLVQKPMIWMPLTLAAWAAQGLAAWLLCADAGIVLAPWMACGFYALAMVGGALSMLPAGLGGMEALFTGLLVLQGADLGAAALATVLVRVLTLWLAVLLGAICLIYSAVYRKDLRLG